ncbi:LOW QUALITY PROTEIN: F-box only protein 33 [Drosophila busckii]|uniref:LOW QUALITY PROTEIN: F-box only protein 33 n=1 Tax=Drosophila busckii TaxID=30019 RepID=UPI001432C6F5|nr:LOW QUALITY PROTEIN: F-box only protein 33 [Drosophila busckii]
MAWEKIPAVALNQIYDYLSFEDLKVVSTCCWSWRTNFFQRRYFKNFRFHIDVALDDQLAFFHCFMCNLAQEVSISFDLNNAGQAQKMRRLLNKVARSDNIRALRLQTSNVGVASAANSLTDNVVAMEQTFIEPLRLLLSRVSQPCQILDLGAIEALTYYGDDLLQALANPQELLELTLASIKYDPSHYPILTLDTSLLQKCAGLQVLSLDYDSLNDEMLHTIQVLPLRKLLIAVHGLDSEEQAGACDAAWVRFSEHFENIQLVLTLIYAYEAVEQLEVSILRRHMPVTHIRLLFCEFMNRTAIDWMARYFTNTLQSIYYIDTVNKYHGRSDLRFIQHEDPLVMLAWCCKKLEEIVVHGYAMDPHNLVGIARLRGRHLKRLEVSQICWNNAALTNAFNDEMSGLLGHEWQPCIVEQLPAGLRAPVDFNARDQYVYELMRKDLSD